MYAFALTIVTALLYLAAAGAIALRLSRGEERGPARSTGIALAAAAVGTHIVVVAETAWAPTGLNLAFFSALSLVSWITCTGLVVASLRYPIEHLGVLLWPLSAVAVLTTLLPGGASTISSDPLLQLHIVISMAAYAMLLAAVLQALVLAALDYRLRHHRATGFVRRIPALQTMERQLFWLVAVGFGGLTVALATGFIAFPGTMLDIDMIHKTSLSVASWIVFGTLLVGRTAWGWRGQTAVRWTLAGFLALMLGYFGTKLAFELILQR